MSGYGNLVTARLANQRRCEEAERRQMARCEAILAEERRLRRPAMVRCACGGVLAKGHLHEHHCPYFGEAA